MNENDLWLQRWKNREIGFNQDNPNAFMLKYFSSLDLRKGARVLVPLCGKSIDISWLLSQGYEVVGIELSEQAIIELFEELGVEPCITALDELLCYRAEHITMYVGDVFKVTKQLLGKIDAVYDRAALVALKAETRVKYAKHLRDITKNAPQLLLCFEYTQSPMNKPPYAVDMDEIKKHYGRHYHIKMLCKKEIAGGFKGKTKAYDVVWLLNESQND